MLGVIVDELGNAAFGYVAEVGHRYGEEIKRERQGFPVEIASGENGDFVLLVKKEQRIIGNRVKLGFNDALRVVDGTVDSTMYLRYAAQSVGVLNVRRTVWADKLAAAEHLTKRGSGFSLHRLGTACVDLGRVGAQGAILSFKRESRGAVGRPHDDLRVENLQSSDGGHKSGAISEGKPFLCA